MLRLGQPLESIQAWNEQMEEPWEKDLGVLVDEGLDMTQPKTLLSWAHPIAWAAWDSLGLCCVREIRHADCLPPREQQLYFPL